MPSLLPRAYPALRLRRGRQKAFMRHLLAEYRLGVEDFIYPLFIVESLSAAGPIAAMPGINRIALADLAQEAQACARLGIPALALFPQIDVALKTERGESAAAADGLVQRAIDIIKQAVPELGVITDVALDPYTLSGHDGVLNQRGDIDNDATVEILVQQALSHAKAGADMVAPSDMMDGRVGCIRQALDGQGFTDVAILSYAAKYASHFYGPFREAVASVVGGQTIDKRRYQMDPARGDEALHEIALDLQEGADVVMIKPGLPYLDIVRAVKQQFAVPTFVYHVSGEYAMLKAAAAQGCLDEKSCVLESMLACKRAGADAVFTYYAKQVAQWLSEA
jgi:porphobilinogen synthase